MRAQLIEACFDLADSGDETKIDYGLDMLEAVEVDVTTENVVRDLAEMLREARSYPDDPLVKLKRLRDKMKYNLI